MRVAYLCLDPGVPVRGTKGAAIHVQQIVRAFRRRGDTVTVYCTRTGDVAPDALGDARIVTRPIAQGDPALREQEVAAAAAELAARAGDDGCDLVYERYALFSDAAARTGAPSVVEVNAPLIEEQRAHRRLVDAVGAEDATRRLFGAASVVAAVSAPVAAWVREHGAARAVIAPNGVDTRAFAPATIGDGSLQAVFLGSLKPWHGVEVAIDAASGLDGVELTVLGDGPERDALQRRALERGAPVRWLAAVPHAAVPTALAGMHVGLAPYPADAGDYFSPLKAYEYLAAGLAVIGSDIGQLPSILEDGRTGMLVPPGDAEALRDALIRLRDDRPRTRALGAAARAQALARHDWDRTLDGILASTPATGRAPVRRREGAIG
ncbi:glycosyltransferase family 4 protein [Leucobacter sp. wl10]|uniref:glycosyltransferase family 4 protein n=1 Tax=Leucobacter sp. wl10 TaxID=2304677 RepID=UPI000E5A3522|nr:glycosyltransferase family 4 protein [Leucobacter sp. wl10]RGE24269.1 glycosyltransferase [Leucobacter sp. wl10]